MERCKTTKEREGAFRRTLIAVVALGTILSADVAFAYTSADYVQSGLIGQWDGIENAGVGIHSGTTNIWKDLVGDCDLTLTANGSWSDGGDALIVSGQSAAADAPAPEYKTIEIVYRMTTSGGRILFSRGGDTKRVVIFDNSGTKGYFDGQKATKCVAWTFDASARRSMTGIYDDSGTVTDVYGNGEIRDDGTKSNTWGAGAVMSIGNRNADANSYRWYGEVYAIRLYDRALTAEEVAQNYAIDQVRFKFLVGPAIWTGGNWSEPSNWSVGFVPPAGSSIILTNDNVAGTVFNVDVDSVSVNNMTWNGNAFTLKGGAITVAQYIIGNTAVSNECDLAFTGSGSYMEPNIYCTFTGNVTANSLSLRNSVQNSSKGGAEFRGRVSAATISFSGRNWSSPPFNFYGKVTASSLSGGTYQHSTVRLYAPGNDIGTLTEGYTIIYPRCADALTATTVVSMVNNTQGYNIPFNLGNYDQTVDKITTGGPTRADWVSAQDPDMIYSIRSYLSSASDAEPTTLTLKATESNENLAGIYDKISIVYAPTGNFTQTFSTNFAHTTSGDIIVSNGTFRVAGTSTFANVGRIVVADGATFLLETETPDALLGVTNIVLGAGAHFAITNAPTAFSLQAASLEMSDTSVFDLPAGEEYVFSSVKIGNNYLERGRRYSGGGSVAQFSGSGKLIIGKLNSAFMIIVR